MDPLQKAGVIANTLIGSGQVSNVYVYGSVASGDYRTDYLDMIACVTDELFRDFTRRLAALGSKSHPLEVTVVALDLLGIKGVDFSKLIGTDLQLNLLLFPTGWLGKLAQVNEAFKLSDAEFTREIARDALWFSPETGVFDASPASSCDYEAGDGFSYTYSLKHGCTAIIVDGPVDYRTLTAKAREAQKSGLVRAMADPEKNFMIEELKQEFEAIKSQLHDLNNELANASNIEEDLIEFAKFALTYLANLKEHWWQLSWDEMRQCENLLFPEGIYLDEGGKISHPSISPVLTLTEAKETKKNLEKAQDSLLVELRGIAPRSVELLASALQA